MRVGPFLSPSTVVCSVLCVGLAVGAGTAAGSDATPAQNIAAIAGTCTHRMFSGDEDNVMRAYVGYYGRPADSGGLSYWADRLAAEGGSMSSIVQAFGVSTEFTARYGSLGNADLVRGIYRQLFGRDPEPGGLAYYVDELTSGRRSLQSIALDVLFGAQNDDALVVANRLAAAKHFTSGSESPGIDPADFDGNAMAAVLASVLADAASRDLGCGYFSHMLDALGGSFDASFTVTKTTDTNDGACNSDCSLREALAAAEASGVRSKIVVPAGTFGLALGPLTVTGDAHFRGAGTGLTFVDGGGARRHFWLESPGARLVVSRLTLQNGRADFGGAIFNKGTTVLDRVELSRNQAFNGGAVLNTGDLVAFSVILTDNKAVSTNASTGFGGALYHESGSYGLFGSRVESNIAPFNGGGIYALGTGVIVDTLITGNRSNGIGGGIDTAGPLTVIGSTLTDNSANDGGGLALRTAAAIVDITTSTIANNIANGLDLGGGGGAFNYQGMLSVVDSTFTGNIAYGEGGGAIETNGALHLANVSFDHNEAKMHGGPLPSDTAPGLGGALLMIAGSAVTIDNASFASNVAGTSGGAINTDRSTDLAIVGSVFTGNSALGLFTGGGGGYGGAIQSEGNLSLTGSTLTGNVAAEAGGAMATKYGTGALVGTHVSGNRARFGGGIVDYANGGTLSVTDSTIDGNTADALGGGLHLTLGSIVTMTGVALSGNVAATNGGAFYNSQGATTTVSSSTLTANRATSPASYGGAIHNDGTLTIGQSTLSGNKAGEAGGALINNIGASTTITNSVLAANTAANGAGIAAYSGTLALIDSSVTDNVATTWGGGLLNGSAKSTLTRVLMTGNQAQFGGGFSNNDPPGRVSLDDTNLSANVATDGSAFVNFGIVDVRNSTLSGTCRNHATVNNQGGNTGCGL